MTSINTQRSGSAKISRQLFTVPTAGTADPMPRRNARQRFTAWIATLAILIGALAPSVSQAMSAFGDGSTRWLEVCTSAGMLWVAADADADAGQSGEDEGGPGFTAGHCPYCCPHAGSFALPPASPPAFAVDGPHQLQPVLYHAAPRPLFAWAAAHPRAPPLAS